MELKPISFSLLDQTGLVGVEAFGKLARKAEEIGRSSGINSGWFDQRCGEFIRGANRKQALESMLETHRDLRVVLQLWLTNKFFRESCPPTSRSIAAVFGLAGQPRANQCYDLIQLYLLYFVELPEPEAVAEWASAILKALPRDRLSPYARRLRQHASLIFAPEGPSDVAKTIARAEKQFLSGMEELGVSSTMGGQFMEACRRAYFVETVRTLLPGESHRVFTELQRAEVCESPFDKRLNVGQAVCTVMIEKCAKLPKGMPDKWLQTVLNVVGDPRRPKASRDYQRWWAAMDSKHEQLMRRWMAGADLQLFLEILEDCSTDEDLKRMYPARKAFLEGLLKHYEVEDASLFLGRDAADFIRREYGPQALLAHGLLDSKAQSVIYLQVGKAHLFEGTHSYAARLSSFLPPEHPVQTRSFSRPFRLNKFTSRLDSEFERGESTRDIWFYVRHHPPLSWQATLMDGFSQLNMRIRPQDVLTAADYQKYRRVYGL